MGEHGGAFEEAFRRRSPREVATALAATCRDHRRRSPAPSDLRHFGLDLADGVGSRLLSWLAEAGMLRHYERVLDASGDLGGSARWLARRFGCRVVGTSPSVEGGQAARLLDDATGLGDAVVRVGSAPGRLPFGEEAFTRAWCVEGLPHDAGVRTTWLEEVRRVVRPGGVVALQVADESGAGLAEEVRAAGFRDVALREAADDREELSAVARLVVARTYAALALEPVEPRPIGVARRGPLWQVTARNPAT